MLLNVRAGCAPKELVMRIGFVHGVLGRPSQRRKALERLEGCDRIVSLGDWLGPRGPAEEFLEDMIGQGRMEFLAGPMERRWSRSSLPEGIRRRLRALPVASLQDGIAVVGCGPRGAGEGEPRLVAPLAVYAHPSECRLWREAGGLLRVESLRGLTVRTLGAERMRLDLSGGGPSGDAGCAIVDLAEGSMTLFAPAPSRQRSATPLLGTQIQLAI